MRELILAWLTDNAVTGYTVTAELPWDSSGQPLYLNNMKRIYVDQPQTGQEPLIDVLNGHGVVNETTTVRVYLATDAKKLPPNYDAVVSMIKSTRLDPAITGVTQRTTTVATEFVADVLVSQFDINFRKLIVNT
ncbi:hypothetical protein UFOVP327_25 [uncultured Caudovirales phage]|uniref:Uncharacterized protein n=1 Tax=uncultured Caudovirales phage TaxID=2100421 RepID=A0A6J5LWD3_9CAUD|nr:hypothetical protein UFOVP327_25 [uncultured Caudovirales phage]